MSVQPGTNIESYETGDTIILIAVSGGKLVVDSRDSRISCLESSRNFLYQVVMVFTLVIGSWKTMN
jgi:hypothetical protein